MSFSVCLRCVMFLWASILFLTGYAFSSEPKAANDLGQSQQDFFFNDDPNDFFDDPMGPRKSFPDFSDPQEILPFKWTPKQPFLENQQKPEIPIEGEKDPTKQSVRNESDSGLPAWLKPGVRITYYVAFSSTPGSYNELAESDTGRFHNPSTGKRYDEREIPGTGGQGLMEVNVAHVDQQVAALDIRLFGKEVGTGDITILASLGDLGEARQCKDFWVHPQILGQVKEMQTESGRIIRMPYNLNNRTYNAIRFQGKSGHHTYDLDSGLLIARHGSAEGAPVLTRAGDRMAAGAGSSYIGILQLLGVRETPLPWNGAPVPEWVGSTRSMTYQGKYTADVTAAGVYSFPVTMRLEFKNKGAGWIHFTQLSQMQAPANMPQPMQGQVERINGSSQVGGLWILPGMLRQLRPGQVLDRDPFTGMQLSVSGIDGTRVRLHEANSRDAIDYIYDLQNGMLVGGTITKTLHMVRMVTSLSLVSRE